MKDTQISSEDVMHCECAHCGAKVFYPIDTAIADAHIKAATGDFEMDFAHIVCSEACQEIVEKEK